MPRSSNTTSRYCYFLSSLFLYRNRLKKVSQQSFKLFRRYKSVLVCVTVILIVVTYVHGLRGLDRINPFKHQLPVEQQDQGSVVSSIFHSPQVFKLHYEQMERRFKIFVYPDGDPNTYRLSGKYASEGYFFKNIKESRFLTDDPQRAHLFFIPISCTEMSRKGLSYRSMASTVGEYVQGLIMKYPYWNRTSGADHFFVTCHEIGLKATIWIPDLVAKSIRVVCGPRHDDGFALHKDFPLPQIVQPFALPAAKFDPSSRTTFAFWLGNGNAELRRQLLSYWRNDTDFAHNPKVEKLYKAKYCICLASWFQVHGVLIPLALHHGCVPVILMDRFELPFKDVLDWTKFSIMIKATEVQQVKPILSSISDAKYRFLHYNAVQVQRHLQWNSPPIKYDAFHMVMYELWLRRHVGKY